MAASAPQPPPLNAICVLLGAAAPRVGVYTRARESDPDRVPEQSVLAALGRKLAQMGGGAGAPDLNFSPYEIGALLALTDLAIAEGAPIGGARALAIAAVNAAARASEGAPAAAAAAAAAAAPDGGAAAAPAAKPKKAAKRKVPKPRGGRALKTADE
jgi:hypothetical protein